MNDEIGWNLCITFGFIISLPLGCLDLYVYIYPRAGPPSPSRRYTISRLFVTLKEKCLAEEGDRQSRFFFSFFLDKCFSK